MSKSYKRLMAAADAAGYVLAAPEDDGPVGPTPTSKLQFEAEFRNGHRLAARKASEAASRAVAKLASAQSNAPPTKPSQALTTTNTAPATSWLNAALAHLRPKGLAA